MRTFSLDEALKAQRALREAAGLGEEKFPVEAFVGMISDEVESLRKNGKSDDEIISIIRRSSAIEITPAELRDNYASPEQRHART